MLDNINKQIEDIKNKVAEKEVLENRLSNLSKELDKSELELKNLEYNLQKEFKDVEKLKKLSLSNILSIIMKNKEEKMEKEEEEYLAAKLKHDQCKSKLDLLKANISDTDSRLKSLSNCEYEYSKLLEKKLGLFNIYGDQENKNKLINMEKELDSYLKEIKEIDESILAGNKLNNEIIQAIKLLDSAKTWGTIDLLGGDFISSLAKHKKVDEAQRHFSRISNLLDNFNKELKDINISSLNFSSTSIAFDVFFDNIFTDISVNSQINKAYGDMCNLKKRVSSILNKLIENKNNLNHIIDVKRKDYDDFIKNI